MATKLSRGVPPNAGAEPRPTTFRCRPAVVRRFRRLSVVTASMAVFAGCGGDQRSNDPVSTIAAPDEASQIDEAELPGAIAVEPLLLQVKTYDGSGELVHPDVSFFPQGWQGRRYWFSATPYPAGDPKLENPSIFSGASSREMLVPAGVSNPLARPEAKSYLSDPDILFDPESGELRMYYRQTLPGIDQLYLATSPNGVQWTTGRLVAVAARYALISPAIVREGAGAWRMWTVNAVTGGCQSTLPQITLQQRLSRDGVSWGDPAPVQMTIPGRVPWHWDVQYVASKAEYWAMIAAYPEGGTCAQTAIYFARSADGTAWKVSPYPLLAAGGFTPIRDLVYRSTFHYHEGSDAVSVWYSGARLEGNAFHYSVALARYPMSELLRRVGGGSSAMLGREQMEYPSAELQAARAAFVAAFP